MISHDSRPARPAKLSCTGHHSLPGEDGQCLLCGREVDAGALTARYRMAVSDNLELAAQGLHWSTKMAHWVRDTQDAHDQLAAMRARREAAPALAA